MCDKQIINFKFGEEMRTHVFFFNSSFTNKKANYKILSQLILV